MSYWAKTYGKGKAKGVAVDENGDIIVVGQKEKDAFVARLDKDGNVKWFRTYGGDKWDIFNDVKIAPNGDIIVAGSSWSFSASDKDVWILRLDSEGNIKWQKTYGGSNADVANAVAIAPNEDIIVAGYTESFGAGDWDVWVLRLDADGNVKWQKTYGGKWRDEATGVAIADNGDIIVAGYTSSFGAGLADVWVLRLDENGNVKWQKTYGGSRWDQSTGVAIADNGEIIVAGYTESFGAGWRNVWVLRLDADGNVKWQKTYGGRDGEGAHAIAIADNGDIIVAGYTSSFGAGLADVWVLRLDENGNVKWQKTYGGRDWDRAWSVALADNGDIIVAGYYGATTLDGSGGNVWVLRLPSDGNLPDCDFCRDSSAQITNTNVEVSNTNCEVLSGVRKYQFEIGLIRKRQEWRTEQAPLAVKNSSAQVETIYMEPETQYYRSTHETIMKIPTSETHQKTEPNKLVAKIKIPPRVPIAPLGEGFPSALLSRYEPLEFLGEGGFAKVFKARRKSDGQTVALKIPRIDERTSSLFLKEIAAWYYLNHPNIVKLYKADIFPIPYLEMEYVEGAKIDDKIVRDLDKYPKPVDENTALKLIVGIAEGLKHAHSKGIWHLDLKPLNVLLKRDLTPKITDWGLAKISTRSSLSTNSGYSPLYAAPEQLDEETYGVPDHRTDIYGLGIIFYELLTGKLPYEGYSPGAVVGKILAKDIKPTPPSKINPALAKYDGIFEKLLAKRKEDRYQSIEEFLQALNALEALHKEREELKKSLKETKQTLKKSRSKGEIQKLTREAVEKTAKIALLSARLNDKAELLNALEDLKFYTKTLVPTICEVV
ncbi:protein kinase [Thermococcus bergensis]|uniref:protein kinase domain-containing protein n=1 Tax=Thermococcus bergensis TaxID=2689387 RepID=UPI001CEDC01A|nr:protein kinase [Thermococcus bergensis]MCA6212788.1 protein kinase [Thermococcus bergensis]